MMRKNFLVLIFCAISILIKAQTPVYIIPQPVVVEAWNNTHSPFVLDAQTKLDFDNVMHCEPARRFIEEHYQQFFGFKADITKESHEKAIHFQRTISNNTLLGDEGYEMAVKEDGIYILANTSAGLFYGFQTLLQLLPPEWIENPGKQLVIQPMHIVDYPRFTWRGCHLDVARHFFPVEYIKKHLDVMAYYKMNKFHWHLTDDHGWRIQIDKYPELTNIGAWRVDRGSEWVDAEPAQPGEKASYGGFYTKKEIEEIVDYAAQRQIEVIPEIEIPGHCSEILTAYPQFACDDYPYTVAIGPYWPPKAILCAGNDDVMQFLKDVMKEIVPLFPCEYIHIGGDEALKTNWLGCPKCKQRKDSLHLSDFEQLQGWMIQEIEKYLATKGRKIIGWDEILDGGVSKQATIMSWRGRNGAISAARHGNDAILTPDEFCYFNYYQGDPRKEPKAICCYVPLEKVYQFDPLPQDSLTLTQQKHILGGQCNLWAEFLFNPTQVEYMLLPRLLALSEIVWSPKESRNWELFKKHVAAHRIRLTKLGYTVSDAPMDIDKTLTK